MTPPPATMSGRRAERITCAARATAAWSGGVRGTGQIRSRNSSSGQSCASACTSCGSARVTAPVSAGSVSTRMAASSAEGSCSGRQMRSKNRDTGRNASLTLMSCRGGQLELLQHRVGHPGGEGVARQQQHRQPVDGGQRGPGHHVGRAWPDRGRAGQRGHPVPGPGERGGRVHHGLLVASLPVTQAGLGGELGLQQALAEAGHVAVPEDAEAALDEPVPRAVPLAALRGQEPHHGLPHRQPYCRQGMLHVVTRGSTGWSFHCSRTHECAGSSQISHSRRPGPAITFR